ncbi:MAG: T9SS type A sorting domain-containing protein [Prevotella sp.]|nr:T9SS type A sorting domain-containing protein [Prevotella sp.]
MISSIVRIIGTLLLLPISCATVEAQTSITYQYDAAGNCIHRLSGTQNRQSGQQQDGGNVRSRMRCWNVQFSPNPTSGPLRVSILGLTSDHHCTITLHAPSGTQLLTMDTSSETTTLDLSTFANGFYIMSVSINNEKTFWKIIKE